MQLNLVPYFQTILAIYYMCAIAVSLMTVSLVSTEVRQAVYDLLDACTTDEPQTVVQKDSKVDCAFAGVREHSDRDFTFDDNTKDCSLYKHKPLFYEARPGCSGYQVRSTVIAGDAF